MALNPGTRLGPYEIVALLGAGGMGEVYRARDPRLRREVAVKILPSLIADDPDRLARFTREAQAASALKHPNIVSVYDVGVEGRAHYLVMELVEGLSLRETIGRGPLPLRQVLQITAQIAEGLADAHAARIVHRDLKPENVMVTPDGRVKILDFGLAKVRPERVADEAATAPPLESFATVAGMTFGTPAYMSPEHATGAVVDYRSDQFALGAILYELASGKTAFHRSSTVETLTAIIRDEPTPLSSLRPDVPAPLVWIVERCLQKDVRLRYDSTLDLARDLVNLRDRATSAAVTVSGGDSTPSDRPLRAQLRWAWGLAAVLGLVAAGLLASRMAGGDAARDAVARPLHIGLAGPGPAGTSIPLYQANTTLALSPDGRTLALTAAGRLFLRAMDSFALTPVSGTEGARSPEWSPDGRYLAFLANGKLKRLEISSLAVTVLADANSNGGISWGTRGTILFPGTSSDGGAVILRIDSEGGTVASVIAPDRAGREVSVTWPHFLPDGRRFLYLAFLVDDQTRSLARMLRMSSLDTADRANVGPIDSRVLFDSTGYLLYAREGSLVAHRFDQDARQFTGEPARLADRFHYFRSTGLADFTISTSGTLMFRTPPPPSRLVWLDRKGTEVGRLGDEALYDEPRISADGSRVAVGISDPLLGTGDLWVFDRALGTSVRVTFSPADERTPTWSPDGSALYYASDAVGPPDLYRRVLRSGREELLLRTPEIETPSDVTRDGKALLFHQATQTVGLDLWKLRLDGSAQIAAVQQSPAGESSARVSPDGRWVAYDSNESGGRYEAYIQSLENPGERWKVSQGGGVNPEWGQGGLELFFVGSDLRLMSAPIRTAPSFQPGTPQPLFRVSSTIYTVLPDGSRFLALEPGRPTAPPINAIINWRSLVGRSTP
jgi:Tol biopolymer transport system component